MKNGRENRTNGNEEKGKEEKEALRSQYEVKWGTPKASPKFLRASPTFGECALACGGIKSREATASVVALKAIFGARFSRAGHKPRNAQKVQWKSSFGLKIPSAMPRATARTRSRASSN